MGDFDLCPQPCMCPSCYEDGTPRDTRADLTPSPEVVKELVEALRAAHEALLWCARDGRMASPSLHQYPAKWAAEAGAALAKLEGGE